MTRLRRSDLPLAAALTAVLGLALALRLTGLRYGLPFPLLNPDEQSIVPRAWRMVHGGPLDPGWYDYPSGFMALLAPFQLGQDEPSYLAARLVSVAAGVAGVAAAFWLGARAYGRWAGLTGAATVAVATVHVAYSRMAVTDVALTLGVTACLALLLGGRLEWAGLAAGLAASAKYPGVMLAVPLLLVGWARWRRLAFAAVAAVAAFAATSPFVVLQAGAAWEDVRRVQRLAQAGWLGFEDDPPTPVAFLDRLWEGLGPALVVAGVGLALAAVRRSRADLVLGSFLLVYAADLLTLDAHFDRYVLPLVPVLGVLAGRDRRLAPFALAGLVVPLAWSLGDARELTRTDTRVVAEPRIEQLVAAGAAVALDPSLPPLGGRRTLELQLPGPGRPTDPNRDLARLRGLGVRYVVLTGAVEDRVLAARAHYPREVAFLEDLRRRQPLLRVAPGGGLEGPWVELYALA